MQDEIKNLALEVVVKSAIIAAQTAVPFLKAPIVSRVFSSLVSWIAGLLFAELSKNYSLMLIEFKVKEQQKEYDTAVTQLERVLSKPKEEQNAEDIAKAKEEFKMRLKILIHLDRFST